MKKDTILAFIIIVGLVVLPPAAHGLSIKSVDFMNVENKSRLQIGLDGQATYDVNGVDLDYDGVLWLGTLAELEDYLESSSGSYIDPVDVPEAYPIKRTEKIPILGKPTAFVRVAYLTPWLNT